MSESIETLKIKSYKAALLGTSGTGKTSAFSSFFLECRHIIAFPELATEERLEYLAKGIDRLVQVRLSISDELKKTLNANAAPLLQSPIDYPKPSSFLHKAQLDLQFDFIPLAADEEPRIHKRSIEIYDSTGEALTGKHENSAAIREELESCDVAIVFLSTKDLLAVANAKSPREQRLAENTLSFADILEPLEKMQEKLGPLDAFPFCVVLSQYDEAKTDEQRRLTQKALSDIISPISRQKPNMQIGICPIALQSVAPVKGNPGDADDKGSYEYDPVNVEWPFLFAVMAVEQRKARWNAEEWPKAVEYAEAAESDVASLKVLRKKNPIGYAFNRVALRMMVAPFGPAKHLGEEKLLDEKDWAEIKRAQEQEKKALAEEHKLLKTEIETALHQHAEDKGLSIMQGGITTPGVLAQDRDLKYA